MNNGSAFSQPDDSNIEIRTVRLGDIQVDEYQRKPKRTSVRVEKFYDPHLYQLLELSERGDGSLYVMDGFQRLTGRKDRDGDGLDTMVLARVHKGLDVAAEVRLFELMNTQRVRVGAFDIIKAQKRAGEKEAIDIFNAVERLGLALREKNGVNTVGSVSLLRKIYRKDGPTMIQLVLAVLMVAWSEDPQAFNAIPLTGAWRLLREARDNNPSEVWENTDTIAATIGANFRASQTVLGQEVEWGARAFAQNVAKEWNKHHRSSRTRFSPDFIKTLSRPDVEE